MCKWEVIIYSSYLLGLLGGSAETVKMTVPWKL